MNLAYDYQRAIDAAQTLREIIRDVAERDRELWPSGAMMIESLAWRLERATTVVFAARRNRLNPDAADETKATCPSRRWP